MAEVCEAQQRVCTSVETPEGDIWNGRKTTTLLLLLLICVTHIIVVVVDFLNILFTTHHVVPILEAKRAKEMQGNLSIS